MECCSTLGCWSTVKNKFLCFFHSFLLFYFICLLLVVEFLLGKISFCISILIKSKTISSQSLDARTHIEKHLEFGVERKTLVTVVLNSSQVGGSLQTNAPYST